MSQGDYVTWERDGEQGRVTCITEHAVAVLWEVTGGVTSLLSNKVLSFTLDSSKAVLSGVASNGKSFTIRTNQGTELTAQLTKPAHAFGHVKGPLQPGQFVNWSATPPLHTPRPWKNMVKSCRRFAPMCAPPMR